MPQTAESTPALPAARAFVVQFYATAAVEQGRYEGRVEHVVSGQATHFYTLDALLAFMARVLTALCTTPEEEGTERQEAGHAPPAGGGESHQR